MTNQEKSEVTRRGFLAGVSALALCAVVPGVSLATDRERLIERLWRLLADEDAPIQLRVNAAIKLLGPLDFETARIGSNGWEIRAQRLRGGALSWSAWHDDEMKLGGVRSVGWTTTWPVKVYDGRAV